MLSHDVQDRRIMGQFVEDLLCRGRVWKVGKRSYTVKFVFG